MKKLKAIVCASLAALIAVSSLAGCTGEEKSTESFDIKTVSFDSKERSQITKKIEELLDETDFSGSTIAKVNKNIVYEGYIGDRNKSGDPIEENTQYQLDSLTRLITCIAVIQLADNGKLSLNDTLNKYFDGKDYLQKITIEDLIDCSAVFESYTDFTKDSEYYRYIKSETAKKNKSKKFRTSIIKRIIEKGLSDSVEPGPSNFYLLGDIIEQTSGEKYDKYIQKNIFDKLDMKDSCFTSNTLKLKGYSLDAKEWRDNTYNPIYMNYDFMYSARGAVSTARDLIKLTDAIFNGTITETDLVNMGTHSKTGYAFGMKVREKTIRYGGGTNLHGSYLQMNTENLSSIVVLSINSGQNQVNNIGRRIHSIFNSKINGKLLENAK